MYEQKTHNRSIWQEKTGKLQDLENSFLEKISQRKGRRQITPWQINYRISYVCECDECYPTDTGTPVNITMGGTHKNYP